ncbi:hypothetical protein LWI29_018400 [Acer saccharum]|uniref:Uncharacterized protein n=1 Tax=Acer saccharum TaxID=4024 RepID=A0AA39T0H6_ACESA|nr:hypothetical protein LWI29_018400 [Acer saccharum]
MKLTSEIKKYLTERKALRKAIKKALESLKAKKLSNENESVAMAGILKEVETVSLGMFEYLLSFISGPKAQSKLSGWSLVSKLTHHKRVASEEGETESNGFAKVDAALLSLIDHKICTADVQNQLKNLVLCIQDFIISPSMFHQKQLMVFIFASCIFFDKLTTRYIKKPQHNNNMELGSEYLYFT